MAEWKLGTIEARFADIIWRSEPVSSGELVSLAEKQLAWKKSTTYTVLKRLCERNIFRNEKGIVTALISREAFYAAQSEKFVQDTFDGSLPAFVAAFTSRKKLSDREISELQKLIYKMRR